MTSDYLKKAYFINSKSNMPTNLNIFLKLATNINYFGKYIIYVFESKIGLYFDILLFDILQSNIFLIED